MAIDLSLYKISDAVQVPLHFKDGKVQGERKFQYDAAAGISIPFTMTAKAIFANDQVGVLFHLMGDLYCVVSHYPKTGGISMFLLDGVEGEDKMLSRVTFKSDLRSVISSMSGCIVKAMYWNNAEWKTLQVPKSLA